jgi:putative SOS response-associated peptidase YedK
VKNQFFKTPSSPQMPRTADGYFEWQKIESQKYPYFHYLTDQHMFAMAGIWNETKKKKGAYDHSLYSPNPLHQIYSISIIACQL